MKSGEFCVPVGVFIGNAEIVGITQFEQFEKDIAPIGLGYGNGAECITV